jgi:hypothetical protein
MGNILSNESDRICKMGLMNLRDLHHFDGKSLHNKLFTGCGKILFQEGNTIISNDIHY